MRTFELDPDKEPPQTSRAAANLVWELGKALDSGCQPLELQDQRDIGRQLKRLASWLHGMAARDGR